MKDHESMLKLCRVCLKQPMVYVDLGAHIIDDNGLEMFMTYQERFNMCTQLNASPKDAICLDCEGDLKISFEFLEKSKKSDEYLQKHVNSNKEDKSSSLLETEIVNVESHKKSTKPNFQFKLPGTLGDNKALQEDVISYIENDLLHDRIKEFDGAIECTICGKMYNSWSRMEPHMNSRHKEVEPEKFCELCERSFHTIWGLSTHKCPCQDANHMRNTRKPFKCDMCDKYYNNHISLENHRNIHLGIRPYSCNFCKLTFFGKHALKMHIRRNHNTQENLDKPGLHNQKMILVQNETKLSEKEKPEIIDEFEDENETTRVQDYPPDVIMVDNANVENINTLDVTVDQQEPEIQEHQLLFESETVEMKREINEFDMTEYVEKDDIVPEIFYLDCHDDNVEVENETSNAQLNENTETKAPDIGVLSNNFKISIQEGIEHYKCNRCDEIFDDRNEAEAHLNSHTDLRHFRCTKCNNSYRYRSSLEAHTRNMHNDKSKYPKKLILKCQLCEKMYASKNGLVSHARKHHADVKFKFEKCETIFKNEEQMKSDSTLLPTEPDKETETEFLCTICEKVFSKERILKNHMWQEHTEESTFNCAFCDISYKTQIELKVHLSESHKNEQKNTLETLGANENGYECEICKMKFQDRPAYEDHINKHKDFYPYECDKCFKSFKTQKGLRVHLFGAHKKKTASTDELVNCEICGKSVTKQNITIHILRTHGNLEKPFLCSSCPKTFASNSLLRLHSASHDPNSITKKCKCEICGKVLINKNSLKIHHKQLHLPKVEKKKINCPKCNKVFYKQNHLEMHMKFHLGLGRKCSICSKQFLSARDLETHMRFHTGDFPLQCELCEKRFALTSHLKEHMRRHAGLKYTCEICEKEFICTSAFRNHKYVHIGMPYPCRLCKSGFSTRSKLKKHIVFTHKIKDKDEAESYLPPPKEGKFTVPKSSNPDTLAESIEPILLK